MKKQKDTGVTPIPKDYVESKILLMRDKKVMLDRDLALLYGVETKVLNQAVKRNKGRFPEDFMFQLTKDEYNSLRSQIVTLKRGQHRKYPPYVFTEQGVAMLSSVLNSEKAIQVNIQIMRTFTKLREMMISYKELQKKIESMEKRHDKHDQHFQVVFKAIQEMLNPPVKKKGKIGFK
ncbi:MAG: ORF6N domain-containing protein [Candidatus Scalindua sp.]|nr:ORF6N domain-containing protein [Candidatus Scalindua sp.]